MRGRPVIAEHDEWQCFLAGDVQPGEIAGADGGHAARRDDTIDGLAAEAGHAQQVFAAGAVDIQRKAVAVPQRPGEFRIVSSGSMRTASSTISPASKP